MVSRKWIIGVMLLGFLGVVSVNDLLAQPGGGPGGGPGFGGGRGNFNPEAMRQRMMDRVRENLGATEAEWKVIEPKLTTVMTLTRDLNPRGMRGFGRRPGRGGPGGPPEDSSRPQSEIRKSTAALETLLEDDNASPDQIKKLLTALRTAREKAKQQLAKEQAELVKVLTTRQEAQLVLMGYLE